MTKSAWTLLFATIASVACAAPEPSEDAVPVVLGPADGRDLSGVDLERVRVGDLAPDFSLESLGGPAVTLSSFRGQKKVVLVFYRGHW